jgi:hypothetical protein
MENNAAARAICGAMAVLSKRTMLLIVSATCELRKVMISTPQKLSMTAIVMAVRGRKTRVETAVAMALGASVHPFTKITPNTSAPVIKKDTDNQLTRYSTKEIILARHYHYKFGRDKWQGALQSEQRETLRYTHLAPKNRLRAAEVLATI